MKFPDQSETTSYAGALERGFLKGAIFGSAVSLGTAFVLKRKVPSFFNTPGGYHRVLLYATPAMFFSITNMERESRKFEAHQRGQQQGHELVAATKGPKPSTMSDWVSKYKYQFIASGWAASLLGSFYVINKKSSLSKSNKLVQARVVAQALTLLMLMASVGASYSAMTPEEATEIKKIMHASSWEHHLPFVKKANNSSY
ncbi:hypothetical protein DASB73_023680 [Starmerella bacillaris]|uniref:HIG1 domain-containing protein n=1 Tax=Starmerella bacillaris TaxID=1247836 RepID=A0AAV5RIY9_STABA|nr:hypothetical protein DASB73_023680 [Starmerella bacillaris]